MTVMMFILLVCETSTPAARITMQETPKQYQEMMMMMMMMIYQLTVQLLAGLPSMQSEETKRMSKLDFFLSLEGTRHKSRIAKGWIRRGLGEVSEVKRQDEVCIIGQISGDWIERGFLFGGAVATARQRAGITIMRRDRE
jgi:hypothetical protein